jgi:hypothetical protein
MHQRPALAAAQRPGRTRQLAPKQQQQQRPTLFAVSYNISSECTTREWTKLWLILSPCSCMAPSADWKMAQIVRFAWANSATLIVSVFSPNANTLSITIASIRGFSRTPLAPFVVNPSSIPPMVTASGSQLLAATTIPELQLQLRDSCSNSRMILELELATRMLQLRA